MRKVVDLPAPEGPIRQTIAPCPTVKAIPRTASTGAGVPAW